MMSTTDRSEPTYELRVGLPAVEGLGRGLYSNAAAVLTELIANAWDADATRVDITIKDDGDNSFVTVADNGCGMTPDQLNERYLMVGYRKRDNEGGESKMYKRPYMGRKGLGKLSVFAIADTLSVTSKVEDHPAAGLTINYPDLQTH